MTTKPFRWPSIHHDLVLAREVARERPQKPMDWDAIAQRLSSHFSIEEKPVELKVRGCRERMDRRLTKFKQEENKALRRSGTEEEYDEIKMLLQDILTFNRDMEELKQLEKEEKQNQVESNKRKAAEIRRAAMEGRAKIPENSDTSDSDDECNDLSDDNHDEEKISKKDKSKKMKGKKRRVSKVNVVEMLSKKYERKAEIQEKELELRKLELDFNIRKHEKEVKERQQRLEAEMEERKTMLQLLLDKQGM